MTLLRALIFALAVALAIEAGIFYLLAGLGASAELVVEAEMVWLCVAAFCGVAFVDRFDHTDDEDRERSQRRLP
jgi:hypothetical protein